MQRTFVYEKARSTAGLTWPCFILAIMNRACKAKTNYLLGTYMYCKCNYVTWLGNKIYDVLNFT